MSSSTPAHGLAQTNDVVDHAIWLTSILWVVLQIWWASPISFWLGAWIPLLDSDEQKFVHLALALSLSMLALIRVGRVRYSPIWIGFICVALALVVLPCLYPLIYDSELIARAGAATTTDIVVGLIGITTLLLFTYISLGKGMVILSVLALAYVLWGHAEFIPESLQWKGASLGKMVSHIWLYTEGIFGISIGVATQFIFLFVLFGEILNRAGFGQFIAQLSLILFARQKAGSAKAAILSSTVVGSISGSSTANVATTGSFTIPLMIKSGMSKEDAGAVEVAASSNGQLMPPIMGAAAFLMAEYTNTPYGDLIYYAALPAICAFFGLLCVVHFQACAKQGHSESTPHHLRLNEKLARLVYRSKLWAYVLRAIALVSVLILVYLFRQNIPARVFIPLAILGLLGLYLHWIQQCAKANFNNQRTGQSLSEVWLQGRHFCLPILVLLWLLIVEGYSPRIVIWWSVICAVLVLWTYQPLLIWFKTGNAQKAFDRALIFSEAEQLRQICITSVKRMLPISMATACAGIIVGTITLSGMQQILSEVVSIFAGDSFFILLIAIALCSLVLGLGLPTTPNYILISSLFALALQNAAQLFGLDVPVVAIHLFILYFGVLADDTPPVGLCACAAGAISGASPVSTGIRAFFLDLRTAILPFAFIYNADLLLIETDGFETVAVIITSLFAMLLFSSALQSWWLVRNLFGESLLLLCATLIFLCPQVIHEQFYPQWQSQSFAMLSQIEPSESGQKIRLLLHEPETGARRALSAQIYSNTSYQEDIFQQLGVRLDRSADIKEVDFFSPADDLGVNSTWKLARIDFESGQRPSPRWFWLIAVALSLGVYLNQRRRKNALRHEHIKPQSY